MLAIYCRILYNKHLIRCSSIFWLWCFSCVCFCQAIDDVFESGNLEITDKQSAVLLSAIAMAEDLPADAAPTDRQALVKEVHYYALSYEDCYHGNILFLFFQSMAGGIT